MTGKIIGICGYKGAGKSTVTQTAIFNPVLSSKALLCAMGIPAEILDNKSRWNEPLDILCGHSTRFAFETLGTEWGKDTVGKNIWINIALAEARMLINDMGISVLFDNVRYLDEFAALRQEGAKIIALTRPGLLVDLSHASERDIAAIQRQCDVQLTNEEGCFARTVSQMRTTLETLISP